ncbi:MAG: FkbM family methyltransferase [Oscillospiraceae bacterium]|nr:FkbM family methyltransferase [Oscillospiraceae bacterium]
MGKFAADVKRFLDNRRFSGAVVQRIAAINSAEELIEKSSGDEYPWLKWFVDSQKEYLKFLKKARFIPGRLLENERNAVSKAHEEAVNKITQNGKVELKNVVLPPPLPEKNAAAIYFSVIFDSLLPYLLEDENIDEALFYALMGISEEGLYEYGAVKLEKGDIVIDAGSNIGEFAALAGARGCKAYAFEPMPSIVDNYLSKTAEMNPGITVCQYALSDKAGELEFDEDLTNLGSSSSVMLRKNSPKVAVQAIDLDTFVHKSSLPRVDFIKADIEGAERYMLRGAKHVLKEFSPKIAICTYHLPDDPKVLRELILDANPNYVIEERWMKMYAHVPSTTVDSRYYI